MAWSGDTNLEVSAVLTGRAARERSRRIQRTLSVLLAATSFCCALAWHRKGDLQSLGPFRPELADDPLQQLPVRPGGVLLAVERVELGGREQLHAHRGDLAELDRGVPVGGERQVARGQ